MKLYNSLTKDLTELSPLAPPLVTIYGCGPTVYDYMHIGNLRTFVFNDLLVRSLQASGFQPRFVQNITDIEDKIIKRSNERGMTPPELTAQYTEAFFADLNSLNIIPADNYPKATEHIGKMIKYIEKLLQDGYAYQEQDGSVYFDISKFADYGKLSQLDTRQLKTGTRVLSDEYSKDNVQDFALWKAISSEEYGYDSPWGKGRPGWHIECSVMSQEYLGPTLDIHTGGIDLLFPHHENEIAQSVAFTGQEFAKIFVHAEHLLVDGAKMSKSLNNFYTLKELEDRGFTPLAFRYLLLTAHYRDKLNFTFESLQAAQNTLYNLQNIARTLPSSDLQPDDTYQEFLQAIQDDLKFPQALAIVWKMLRNPDLSDAQKSANLTAFDQVLGLNLANFIGQPLEVPEAVQKLIDQRETAKSHNDYQLADQLRDQIRESGFEIEDTPAGPRIKQK